MTKSLGPLALVVSISAIAACGNNAEPYKPQPAWSGPRVNLPTPPSLPTTPIKIGSDYTVFGAIHHLRSDYHFKEVTEKPISITGYIVETNLLQAPECAIHPMGKKDPDKCDPPIPSFYIADNKGDTKGQKIRVLNWARNFAVVYDAMREYAKSKKPPKDPIKDETLNVDIPYPLPAVGAKVTITGTYGMSTSTSTGMVSDPESGVFKLDSGKLTYIEPPTDVAAFAKKLSSYPQ